MGGSVMHNLALALHQLGHHVTGSDDQIYDPAKGRLEKAGILPSEMGWHADRIHPGLDAVILGMHAREGNPELDRANELGLRIFSFPEYIYEHAKDKTRIAICGSHGKTTITSMVLHGLLAAEKRFDYLVGAQLKGFQTMVGLSADAPIMVIEGDEYLTSPIDRRPKFLVYQPQVALLSGISWDHINVFPTEEIYENQFVQLAESIPTDGFLVYNLEDPVVVRVVESHAKCNLIGYRTPDFRIENHQYVVTTAEGDFPLQVIGRHNLSNLAGAAEICRLQGISPGDYWKSMQDFSGASLRLEKIWDQDGKIVFRDFAHSPSKVNATVKAVEELFGPEKVVAVLELHTFSSTNKDFLPHYKDSLKGFEHKILLIDKHTLERKNYPEINAEEAREAFNDPELRFARGRHELLAHMAELRPKGNIFLLMSSGNFSGIPPLELALGK